MESESDLQSAYNNVLMKIGRNLLLFQQAELLIKRLVALDSVAVHSGLNSRDLETRISKFDSMTMGQVANLFLERICPTDVSKSEPDAVMRSIPETPADQSSIHLRIRLGGDPDTRRKSFAELIQLRNQFVHRQIRSIDPDSMARCIAAATEMDALRLKILPEILQLQQDIESTRIMLEMMTAYLDIPAGMAVLLRPEVQQSPLITNLAEIARKSTDSQGWSSLGDAILQLQDFPSGAILKHCAQFGQKSLTALLQASGLFQTEQRDATETCHGRTFYRLSLHAERAPASQSIS